MVGIQDSQRKAKIKAQIEEMKRYGAIRLGEKGNLFAFDVASLERRIAGIIKEPVLNFLSKTISKLKNPQEIKPFEINKTGFGAMSAWITVDSISRIKK